MKQTKSGLTNTNAEFNKPLQPSLPDDESLVQVPSVAEAAPGVILVIISRNVNIVLHIRTKREDMRESKV